MNGGRTDWPVLPRLDDWRDTFDTLHMWTQVVGKIRLALAPAQNHSWGVAFYVTTRGLTTSPMPHGRRTFAIDFDFVDHRLRVTTCEGEERSFALVPTSVADFYRRTMATLDELGLPVPIFSRPVEIPVAIRFEEDRQHASYDPRPAHLFWRALVQAERVLSRFRAGFIGKVSPVHFFWGGFDLAVTRFSGRTAPRHPGGIPNCPDRVMVEAYSHQVSSAGFWPGSGLGGDEAASFYSYTYPQPPGFDTRPVQPAAAFFHRTMGEFILPYEAVRAAAEPDQALLAFLQSTYEAAAELGAWDRTALERR
jgi:hypothetical protein